jgi:exodeoxyribonuclease V alpha subunit
MEVIEARLDRIRFANAENGFLIGIFYNSKHIVALGNCIRPEIGQDYKLHGEWIDDPKWGKQFRFQHYETVVPKSTDGIFRYIVRIAKWVGPSIGNQLIRLYGEETLNILANDPERVASDVRGITPTRAREIQALIRENRDMEAVLVALEELLGDQHLRKSLPIELAKHWGSDAIEIIKDDPYVLTQFSRIGFLGADRVAIQKLQFDVKALKRQTACIQHVLRDSELLGGNTWMRRDDLLSACEGLIGYEPEEGLGKAIARGDVAMEKGYVAREKVANDERYIANKIHELMEGGERGVDQRGYSPDALRGL